MRAPKKALLLVPSVLFLLTGCGTSLVGEPSIAHAIQKVTGTATKVTPAMSATNAKHVATPTPTPLSAPANLNDVADPAQALPPNTAVGPNFDWTKPSGGPYPTLTQGEKLWIDCNLTTQRINIMNGNQSIYTMITSSGLDGADTVTPTGTYYVEPERGTWFYTNQYQEGAEYWVSWKGHGEFLFHSVPMDQNKKVIPQQAANLGVKSSHGCFHLTLADAKWIYDNITTGTKVVIHD